MQATQLPMIPSSKSLTYDMFTIMCMNFCGYQVGLWGFLHEAAGSGKSQRQGSVGSRPGGWASSQVCLDSHSAEAIADIRMDALKIEP